VGDNSKDVKFNYPKEYVDLDKPKMECNHKFRQECKLCGIIKVGSIYPHNMTETQWRHELAARFASSIIIERPILASALLVKAGATEGRELDMAIGRINKVPVSVEAYKLADAMIEEGNKDD
jgi:hypothetical protein